MPRAEGALLGIMIPESWVSSDTNMYMTTLLSYSRPQLSKVSAEY